MTHSKGISLFGASLLLTAAGFFVDAVPFAIAYLPFGFAILIDDQRTKALFALGHYIWPATIAAWGLIQLDHSPFYIVPMALAFSVFSGWFTARYTVGLSAVMLAAVPFIPDNPLLVTGSLLPGFGVVGLIVLPIALLCIERLNDLKIRAALMAGITIPALGMSLIVQRGPNQLDLSTREVNVSTVQSITRTGRWADIEARITPGDTAILGENIFDHTDVGAISHWCRVATDNEATLFIGVRGLESVGEVWKFDATTCPSPSVIYRAQIGIPTVTGGWLPHSSDGGLWGPAPNKPQWIACFEGFSLVRWIGVGLSGTQRVVVISNDKWTEPFPVGALRRKVGGEFAKLYGIDVAYAETGRSFLIERASQP